MTISIPEYLKAVSIKFFDSNTSEMGYRADFEKLLETIFPKEEKYLIHHDPKSIGGNKPDFIVLKNSVPILYIEAKDIGVPLDKIEQSDQMKRYFGYSNLILTDYLEFRFYRNGVKWEEAIKIGNYDLKDRTIESISENFERLPRTVKDFTFSNKEPIKSGSHLARIMGGRSQRIRDNVLEILQGKTDNNDGTLKVFAVIKNLLVHDLSYESFADMYAQTLVYGLFVARYYDSSPKDFSRLEAQRLIPASNPFLGHFFDHISGRNFEKRLSFIVDELCEIFSHADVKELMTEYFKQNIFGDKIYNLDPVIHFYEDFLKEYDENLRKKMGAYYTPTPVVNFIVRSVDEVLKTKFNLLDGVADATKLESGDHKVQILDPAVGTGTFIGSVVDKIYDNFLKNGQDGRWPQYVHYNLLPRLHGFELMMSPYTIAHLKISMKLANTGFSYFNETRDGKTRLGIYLTNSLEEAPKQPEMLAFDFGAAIAEEAKKAQKIKNDTPIMVVIGNPPYSVSSSNKGKWIQDQIKVYKQGLNERKINLDDDYIKFIRFAEHFIEKNKTGVVAMITNNSFIDGVTHRQMRKHLLETFDEIYILDLHGNSKKKEKSPDGSKDENVFNIMQGVSINLFVRKNENKKGFGKVFHFNLFGKRKDKFDFLNNSEFSTIKWQELNYKEPYFFFVPKDFSLEEKYKKGFKVDELFTEYVSGFESIRDEIVINFSKKEITDVVEDFKDLTEVEIMQKYNVKDARDWKVSRAKKDIVDNSEDDSNFKIVNYRPFDKRYTFFTGNQNGFVCNPKNKVMRHMLKDNVGLVFHRNPDTNNIIFISNSATDRHLTGGLSYVAPLWLYPEKGENLRAGEVGNVSVKRTSNINIFIARKIAENIKLVWYPIVEYETKNGDNRLTPEEIFDYIYATLHSQKYREKYKEFLKIDFPRVLYPKNKKYFDELVSLGKELREVHLFESPKLQKFITKYPVAGSNIVEKVSYKNGKVFINLDQYFEDVPEIAWDFYIGGYQPAQKWLKDRKGRELTDDDLSHYQRIVVALVETDKIVQRIDKVIEL